MNDLNLEYMILNNTIYSYIISFLIILIGNVFIRIFKKFFWDNLVNYLNKISESLSLFAVESLETKLFPLFNILLFYLSFIRLDFSNILHKIIELSLFSVALFYIIQITQDLMIYSLKNYWEKKQKDINQSKMLQFIIIIIRIFVWIIGIVVLLENMNVEVTGLLTGLGISGIAIAFASQKVLADIFSYFTIFFDRPFDIGDFIIIDNYRGTVEHIGIKTTRIKSLSGEQLVFSNNDLTNSRISNYGKMKERRINFKIGVVYSTSLEKIKTIPDIIEEIISNIKKTTFDRAHFGSYGDFSLIFEVVYYVKDSDYKVYMDLQEEINLKIKEKFEELNIELAYPTQSIYLNKVEDEKIDLNNIKNKNEVE
ncbi:MAG: mechanosensitive ion channel family protein [Bacillota bacterium]